jgi:hypothetical protein
LTIGLLVYRIDIVHLPFWQFVGVGKGEVTGATAHTAAYMFFKEFIIANPEERDWLAQYLPEQVKDSLRHSQRFRGDSFVRIWSTVEDPKPHIVLRRLNKQKELVCLTELGTPEIVNISYSDCIPDPNDPLQIKYEKVELPESHKADLLMSKDKEVRTRVGQAILRLERKMNTRKELNLV